MITDTSILKDIYRIYTKEEWGGKEATSFIEMKLPVPYVVISHTVTNRCYKFQSCSALLRNIQSYHFSLEYADISGNFYVDSSGNIYEGRGWKRRNTAGSFVNGRNLAISFIGDFSKEIKPSEKQLEAVRYLIQYAEESGKIAKEYALLAANSTHATLSPGKNVYRVIKTWPHFDPEPRSHLYDLDDY